MAGWPLSSAYRAAARDDPDAARRDGRALVRGVLGAAALMVLMSVVSGPVVYAVLGPFMWLAGEPDGPLMTAFGWGGLVGVYGLFRGLRWVRSAVARRVEARARGASSESK